MRIKPLLVLLLAFAFGACARRPPNGELVGIPSKKSLEKTYSKDFPLPKKILGDAPIPKNKLLQWPEGLIARDSARYSVFAPGLMLGVSEITNTEYCFFLNQNPDSAGSVPSWIDLQNNKEVLKSHSGFAPATGYGNFPARYISFLGAIRYCAWLSDYINTQRAENGLMPFPNFRLPLKEETELVAAYLGEEALSPRSAWAKGNAGGGPKETKSSKPAGGIFGFYGNVSEWRIDSARFVRDHRRNVQYFEYEFSRGGGSFAEEGMGTVKPETQKNAFYAETGFRVCMSRLLKHGRETTY